MLSRTNPTLLEFHLSYKDMDKDIGTYFDQVYDLDLVVHSPELFAGDHLLNLCADDSDYRTRSVAELQRVVDLTRTLQPFFKRSQRPPIIVNVGGFSKDGFIDPVWRGQRYDQVAEALAWVDTAGIEIIPQTYPPFPWLFGGQFYHNLFLAPDDIARFCQTYGYRICLDVSHSKLACNHFGWSLKEFVDEVGAYAAHLHIADAKGIDGEGLQVGAGEIDFAALAENLAHCAPEASFIPEIWQGHENDGAGFWTALEHLERYF